MLGDVNNPIATEKDFLNANFKESNLVFKKCSICGKVYHSRFRLKYLICRSCKILMQKKNNGTLKHSQKTKENISKSLKTADAQEKRKQTCLQKYGYENPAQSPDLQFKRQQTCIKKYGGVFSNSKTIAEKIKNTNEIKYGTDNWTKSLIGRKTLHRSLSSKESIEKRKHTCLERYGVESVKHLPDIVSLSKCLYQYDNEFFDSSWELAFWIYHKDLNNNIIRKCGSFDYVAENVAHKYFPDFKLNNLYIEIKGPQFFNESNQLIDIKKKAPTELTLAKQQCMIEHHVKIITDCSKYIHYVHQKYGNDFLKKFKIQ